MMPFEETSTNEAPPIERQQEREREEEQRRLAQSRAQSQQPTAQQRQMQQQQTRHYYESITTSGCGNTPSQAAHNIQTFNLICWPILEKEGGWTCMKGTGHEEGITIFCPPGVEAVLTDNPNNSDRNDGNLSNLVSRLLKEEAQKEEDKNNAAAAAAARLKQQQRQQQQQQRQQQQEGQWQCSACGTANDANTIRCLECFGWRIIATSSSSAYNNNNAPPPHPPSPHSSSPTNKPLKQRSATTTNNNQQYYIKIRHVITRILRKENDIETKAADAYLNEVSDALDFFAEEDDNDSVVDDDGDDGNGIVSSSPPHSPRMTRQRFTDIAWKENRTHYEKSSSRVGVEYQVDVLPVAGSYFDCKTSSSGGGGGDDDDGEDDVLYDQVWDQEKAQKSGKIDFIHHRVKSSIREPAYEMLHQRDYRLPGFFEEVASNATPTDCSHWTAEERAKFRKLVFEKHEDMWQISEALGRPVRECVTYYLGKFKTSKDFRSLRRVMEKARDENAFKYPGEILCDKCGKGGKLVYCDTCDRHYHLTCQDPPLLEVPENNDWKCNKCMEGKVAAEEEDTSNGDDDDDDEVEVFSSVEGQRNDTNDDDDDDIDVGSNSTANQNEQNNNSVEEKKEAASVAEPANDTYGVQDAMSNSSVSAGEGKRPSDEKMSTEQQQQQQEDQPQAKKAKKASSFEEEEDTSMTSFGSDEVSGVDSEMGPAKTTTS